MITMADMTERYGDYFQRPKIHKSEDDIKIPYDNLSSDVGILSPGDRYIFFGTQKHWALDIWRINLLWQLAKKNVPIHILNSGKRFEQDFKYLLCLQSKVPHRYFTTEWIPRQKDADITKGLETIKSYPIVWHSDEFVLPTKKVIVCVQDVSLEEVRNTNYDWINFKEDKIVLIQFVKMPQLFVSFDDIYSRKGFVSPERLGSVLGLVKFASPFNAGKINVQMRRTNYAHRWCTQFDFDWESLEITPSKGE